MGQLDASQRAQGVPGPLLVTALYKLPPSVGKVVIVSTGDRRIGLVVDQLLGDHQAVINPLSRLHRDVQSFSGATILRDGSVVLILDVLRLIEFGRGREERLRAS